MVERKLLLAEVLARAEGHCRFLPALEGEGNGARNTFGALIVGYFQDGKLRYASKVGTGFSNALIRQLKEMAEPLCQPRPPFNEIPESGRSRWGYGLTAAERRTSVWLKPVLVCQVRFTEWTEEGHLRHPAFLALRDDKPAQEVVRVKRRNCSRSRSQLA